MWNTVAALLWQVDETEQDWLFEQPCTLSLRQLAQLRTCAKDALTQLQTALPIAAAADLAWAGTHGQPLTDPKPSYFTRFRVKGFATPSTVNSTTSPTIRPLAVTVRSSIVALNENVFSSTLPSVRSADC